MTTLYSKKSAKNTDNLQFFKGTVAKIGKNNSKNFGNLKILNYEPTLKSKKMFYKVTFIQSLFL